ncbi:MAG: response regulator [Desulfobacterales bacterium]
MSETKKILIVEDEQDILAYFEAIFQDNGYDTVSAKDGIEGFELGKSEKPDLITLDITMPMQSGLKIYRQFKDHPELKNIPVIIITAHNDFLGIFLDDLKEYARPESIFYKPIDPRRILKLIAEILSD